MATPVIGRLGDGRHRRTVVLVVLTVVLLGNVLAALPLGLGWLVAGRGLQGLGLGLTPLAIATARTALAGERSRATVAALSVTVAAGVGLGYPLTGAIAEFGGVHAAFWFGAAASALALVAAALVYPPFPDVPPRRLDVAGAVLLGIGLSAGLLARGRVPATAHGAALLVGLANYLLLSSVPRLAQTPESTGYGVGTSIVVAGLVLLPFSVASLLASRLGRPLDRAAGPRVVLPAGALVLLLGTALFGLVRDELWQLFAAMAVAGFGVGLTFAALPGLIVGAVPAGETGSAMSLKQVLRYTGFALGSALSATVLEALTPAGADAPPSSGYTALAAIGCGACLALAVLTAFLPGRAGDRAPAPSPTSPPPSEQFRSTTRADTPRRATGTAHWASDRRNSSSTRRPVRPGQAVEPSSSVVISGRSKNCAVARALGWPSSGSAPAASRKPTVSADCLKTAAASAVCPRSLARVWSAPRSSSAATVDARPW